MTSSPEPGDDYGRDSWERRWTQALSRGEEAVNQHPPNAHLLAEVADLPPGRALDAGAGHGAETVWLAGRGWRVTAVDFSATVLDHARSRAERLGAEIAERVEWIEADLRAWTPPPAAYDLVACVYVHVAGSVPEMVQRLASGVAAGGTLLLIGRRPAGGQVQVDVASAVAALEPARWELLVAEDRPLDADRGVDAVVRARRLSI